ncbi:hypothetical protein V9T40_013011 [Parthenolecanium corni]|uniref:Amino acid transporter transmembrane domain-containing protein n=1 Tax=Parthenolecanium corni TaxID=536013 RepID=A0AAN9T8R8_9HEMI
MGIFIINTDPARDENCPSKLEANRLLDDLDEESGIGCRGGTLHVVRVSIGTGILFMPYTIHNLGYVMGAAVFLLAGIIYYHVARMILLTETKMCQQLKVTHLSYVELASQIFRASPFPFNKCASPVKYLICVFYSMPFANTVYLVVMGEAVQTLASCFEIKMTTTIAVSILIVPLTIFCMFQSILKILIPYSSVTNVFTALLAFAIIIVAVDYKTESTTLRPIGDVTFIPKSLAMYIQVFSCTSLLFAIKNDMQKPQKLTKAFGILNVSAFLVMLVHYGFGLGLYVSYGNAVHSDILKNMPDGKVTYLIKSLFCLTLFVSYILCFFARFNNVWTNTLKPNFKNQKYASVVEYSIRIGYNLLSCLLAVTLPNLALVSAFAGSLSLIVDIGLSSMLVLLHRISHQKISFLIISKNVLIIGVCLVLFVVSMIKNVNEIIT